MLDIACAMLCNRFRTKQLTNYIGDDMKMTLKQTIKAIEKADTVIMYVNAFESWISVDKEQALSIARDLSLLFEDDEDMLDVTGTKSICIEEID